MQAAGSTLSTKPAARTIARSAATAAERYGDRPALRYRSGDGWREVTFAEVAGDRRGDRARAADRSASSPATGSACWPTRASGVDLREPRHLPRRRGGRADLPDQLPRGVRVGRRQLRGARHRDLRGRGPGRRRSSQVRDAPARTSRQVVVIDGPGERRRPTFDELRARGPRRATAPSSTGAATRSRPTTPASIIYTSGHHRPAQGRRAQPRQLLLGRGDVPGDRVRHRARTSSYLYLPLAHVFALTVQLASFDVGTGDRLLRRRPQADHRRAHARSKPTYFPSVPRIFEKIYAARRRRRPRTQEQLREAVELGCAGPRAAPATARTVPDELQRRLRPSRRSPVRQGPRAVRRRRSTGGVGRRADRHRDPRVLPRLRGAGARGLRA